MDLPPALVVGLLVAFGVWRLITAPASADDPRAPVLETVIMVVAGSVGYIVLHALLKDQSGWGDIALIAVAVGLLLWLIGGMLVRKLQKSE